MITLFYENLQCIEKSCILIEKTPFAERLTFNFSGKKTLYEFHIIKYIHLIVVHNRLSVFVKTSQFSIIVQEKPAKALPQKIKSIS